MVIPGCVHLLFEQSGSFKNAFRELGFSAFDYDWENNFGEVDFLVDLFSEIEAAFVYQPSIFDRFSSEDLIIAFFPCTYFSACSSIFFCFGRSELSLSESVNSAISRLSTRTKFHTLLLKLVYVCVSRNLRLIIENPASKPSYLLGGVNFPVPTLIDNNRCLRGDFFKKPTAYWFFGCTPAVSNYSLFDYPGYVDSPSKVDSLNGFSRSKISSIYAKNFISEFILGF